MYYELGLDIGQVSTLYQRRLQINFYVPAVDRVACLYYQPHQEMGFLAMVGNMANL